MALAGMLDERPHTSDNLEALQAVCHSYSGAEHYTGEPAQCDGDLITASGIAPIEFARAVLDRLGMFALETLDAWYRLHTLREEAAYFDLMTSLPHPAGVGQEGAVSRCTDRMHAQRSVPKQSISLALRDPLATRGVLVRSCYTDAS